MARGLLSLLWRQPGSWVGHLTPCLGNPFLAWRQSAPYHQRVITCGRGSNTCKKARMSWSAHSRPQSSSPAGNVAVPGYTVLFQEHGPASQEGMSSFMQALSSDPVALLENSSQANAQYALEQRSHTKLLPHAYCSRNFCRKTAGGLLIKENQCQPGCSRTVPVWCQCPRTPFQEGWPVLDAAVCNLDIHDKDGLTKTLVRSANAFGKKCARRSCWG